MENVAGASGWRKSTRCETSACVEVNTDGVEVALMRDSKNVDGPVLAFGAEAWAEFLGVIKSGGLSGA